MTNGTQESACQDTYRTYSIVCEHLKPMYCKVSLSLVDKYKLENIQRRIQEWNETDTAEREKRGCLGKLAMTPDNGVIIECSVTDCPILAE